MGKELQFPTKMIRDWRLIEGAIADVLRQARASDDMRKQVTAHMKEHYLALNQQLDVGISLPLPGSMSEPERESVAAALQEGFARIEAGIHQQSNLAITQLLATEVRLYIAQHGHP